MSETLASPVEVERILELKTVRDPASRAHFLAAVRECARDGDDFTLARLRKLMAIDEHFQALVLYDQIEYLRRAEPTEADREFALNIQRVCLEAANGFQRFLRNRDAWATDRETLDLMFRVTGLALNAIHAFVKWGYFLNESRAAPWKQLHALYMLADNDGFSRAPFVLYPSRPSFKPSVQSLYLRTLILDLLNTGSLTRIQVEIADGWFSSWCNDYSLDAEYSSRLHLFYVDVAANAGMQLMRRDSLAQTLRFMRADSLKAQIDEVQAGLRHGQLFAGHGAGSVFPVEQHVALLAIIEKLYHSTLANTENRIEERTHFEDREVDVTVGVERIMRKARERAVVPVAPGALAAAPSQAETIEITPAGMEMVAAAAAAEPGAAAPAADPEVERWRVHDLSSGGYGLIVDRANADAVLLNGLLALRNHETGGWIVGSVVRKLPNRVRGEMLVGVEVLAYRPIPIQLVAEDGTTTEALYLPGTDTNGKQDAVIVRPGEFSSASALTVWVSGRAYRIRLNRIIRKGSDWIKARFEIETKPA